MALVHDCNDNGYNDENNYNEGTTSGEQRITTMRRTQEKHSDFQEAIRGTLRGRDMVVLNTLKWGWDHANEGEAGQVHNDEEEPQAISGGIDASTLGPTTRSDERRP